MRVKLAKVGCTLAGSALERYSCAKHNPKKKETTVFGICSITPVSDFVRVSVNSPLTVSSSEIIEFSKFSGT
jgi:hypothetical protein